VLKPSEFARRYGGLHTDSNLR